MGHVGYAGVFIVDFAGCKGDTWQPKVRTVEGIYAAVPPAPLQMDRYSAGSPLVHEGLMYGIDWYGVYYVIDLAARKKRRARETGKGVLQ